MKVTTVLLSVALFLVAGLCLAVDSELVSISPEASGVPLVNPGKGWVHYGFAPQCPDADAIALTSTGYNRITWQEVEPWEGQYNWKKIDDALSAWSALGKPFAFGIMAGSSHHRNKYVTPKWVFDAGCEPRKVKVEPPKTYKDIAQTHQYFETQIIPAKWDDPVFLQKLVQLLRAVAARYDGDPRVCWYEIRSYGNWGEGHLWPWGGQELSHDGRLHHIQLHREIFKVTPLMVSHHFVESDDHFRRAVRMGVGVRDDGVISIRDGKRTAMALGYAPAAFEWAGGYRYLRNAGYWNKPDYTLEDCVRNGRVTWSGLARYGREDIRAFLDQERPLIDKLTNLMGYHFRLSKISYARGLARRQPIPVTLTWHNDGVAAIHIPCYVALATLRPNGEVHDRVWLDNARPGSWAPGQEVIEKHQVVFKRVGMIRHKLAIGLFTSREAAKPDIALGMEGRNADGWYVLGDLL